MSGSVADTGPFDLGPGWLVLGDETGDAGAFDEVGREIGWQARDLPGV